MGFVVPGTAGKKKPASMPTSSAKTTATKKGGSSAAGATAAKKKKKTNRVDSDDEPDTAGTSSAATTAPTDTNMAGMSYELTTGAKNCLQTSTFYVTLICVTVANFLHVRLMKKGSDEAAQYFLDFKQYAVKCSNHSRFVNEGIMIPAPKLNWVLKAFQEIRKEMNKKANYLIRTSKNVTETVKSSRSEDCITSCLLIEVHARSNKKDDAVLKMTQSFPHTPKIYEKGDRILETPMRYFDWLEKCVKDIGQYKIENKID